MSKRLAVALCVHHKPWLIMSTLITLALQDWRDFDIYFLYQVGDGACPGKKSYEAYFRLAEEYGKNKQLSKFDETTRQVTKHFNCRDSFYLEFENDHTLDSGAWYKFIRTDKWRDYDRVLFIQEGTIFTRSSVLSASLDFAQKHSIHFLSSAHEKRKFGKNRIINHEGGKENLSEYKLFYDKKISEVFDIYCRNKGFKKIYGQWESDSEVVTQNHVPDLRPFFRERLHGIAQALRRKKPCLAFGKTIFVNSRRYCLRDVVKDYLQCKGVLFHKDNGLEWYGCSCQHLFSNEFLRKFSQRMNEDGLYEVLDVPFSGEVLEIIWGFLPNWLGFDKWFFDGLHRIRKNFVSYEREDNPEGMCRYINAYFSGAVNVVPEGNFVKIKRMNKKLDYLKDILGKDYFLNG